MSDDYDVAMVGMVTTLFTGLATCINSYNDSSKIYYDSVLEQNRLVLRNAEDERRHSEELARIQANKELVVQCADLAYN